MQYSKVARSQNIQSGLQVHTVVSYGTLKQEKYVLDEEYDETDIDRLKYEILCKISSMMFEKYEEYFSNLINSENIA